jgi:hypothetical protein
MVHVKNEGGHFDAPIETVWAYLKEEEAHSSSHSGARNRHRKELSENSMLVSWEQDVGGGKWIKMENRITVLPPVGLAIEVTEGPMAGSKFMNFYTPHGNSTEVTVVGEFTSKQIPEAELEPAVDAFLEEVYNEDVAGIRAFSQKK